MTYQEIDALISGIGLPYAYYQFSKATAQPPPFICFFYSDNNDMLADNTNYQTIAALNVEFYSDLKDFQNEARIEAALTGAGLVFAKSEVFIDSEQMHETIYTMEVIINGED